MTDPLTEFLQETLVLDTETTSLSHQEAEVIQYASADVLTILGEIAAETYNIPASFHKPETPIPPEVSAITSITNRMVEGHEPFKDAQPRIQAEFDQYKYFVAHNAFYDSGVLSAHGMKLPKAFCTMRMARKLFAEDEKITAHNLSYLRYALDLPISDTLPAHLADADVMVTGIPFYTLLEIAMERGHVNIEEGNLGAQLDEWMEEPIIVTKMTFGKHKGRDMVDVPLDYWQWALENFDSLDENDSAYDRDFAASVTKAIETIFERKQAALAED